MLRLVDDFGLRFAAVSCGSTDERHTSWIDVSARMDFSRMSRQPLASRSPRHEALERVEEDPERWDGLG